MRLEKSEGYFTHSSQKISARILIGLTKGVVVHIEQRKGIQKRYSAPAPKRQEAC